MSKEAFPPAAVVSTVTTRSVQKRSQPALKATQGTRTPTRAAKARRAKTFH